MSRLPRPTGAEVVRALGKAAFEVVRIKGCGALHAFGWMKVLRAGPAPLTLVSLGASVFVSAKCASTRDCEMEPRTPSAKVRSVIDRLFAEGSLGTAPGPPVRHEVRTVSISPAEGEALTRWVLRENARTTIEIGLAFGISALHICDGLVRAGHPDARHVVLDPFQATGYANRGLQALEAAGVAPIVEFHDRISQVALPAFLAEGREFDLAFVDGNHRFDAVFLDLFYLGRLLPRGGIILVDDYDLPGIRRAVSFYLANLGWRVEETSRPDDAHSWVVLRTASTEDNRDFRYFAEF